jgi:hypothetical protein
MSQPQYHDLARDVLISSLIGCGIDVVLHIVFGSGPILTRPPTPRLRPPSPVAEAATVQRRRDAPSQQGGQKS